MRPTREAAERDAAVVVDAALRNISQYYEEAAAFPLDVQRAVEVAARRHEVIPIGDGEVSDVEPVAGVIAFVFDGNVAELSADRELRREAIEVADVPRSELLISPQR